jgi:hypothetical protein
MKLAHLLFTLLVLIQITNGQPKIIAIPDSLRPPNFTTYKWALGGVALVGVLGRFLMGSKANSAYERYRDANTPSEISSARDEVTSYTALANTSLILGAIAGSGSIAAHLLDLRKSPIYAYYYVRPVTSDTSFGALYVDAEIDKFPTTKSPEVRIKLNQHLTYSVTHSITAHYFSADSSQFKDSLISSTTEYLTDTASYRGQATISFGGRTTPKPVDVQGELVVDLLNDQSVGSSRFMTLRQLEVSLSREGIGIPDGQLSLDLRRAMPELVSAVETRDPMLVRSLLNEGADPNTKSKYGTPCLSLACGSAMSKGDETIVKYLLEAGADVNAVESDGDVPVLIRAVTGESPAIIKRILDAGAALEGTDKLGMTPLHHAVLTNNPETVRLLLARGANVLAKDRDGSTPFDYARESRPTIVPILRKSYDAATRQKRLADDAAARQERLANRPIIDIVLNDKWKIPRDQALKKFKIYDWPDQQGKSVMQGVGGTFYFDAHDVLYKIEVSAGDEVLNRYYDKLTQAFGSHDDFVNQNEPRTIYLTEDRGSYFRRWLGAN